MRVAAKTADSVSTGHRDAICQASFAQRPGACGRYTEAPFPELVRHPADSPLEDSEVRALPFDDPNVIVNRYVDIPCPSGKHRRSIVTFRNHSVAAMFCIPCEHAWTEPTDQPALQDLGLDSAN
jgi:hypothetical protein